MLDPSADEIRDWGNSVIQFMTDYAAFVHEAEYTRIIGQEADEAFAFWDYGPELSRRFRALKVWMLLKGVGLDALRKNSRPMGR